MPKVFQMMQADNSGKSMQKNIQLKIQSLSHEGRGIGKIDGKTIFIDNALPEETILCQIDKRHRRYDEGRAIEIIEPSPDRVEPLCIHFYECGGCQLQHLAASKQINMKESFLLEQLHHFGGIQPKEWLPPLTGPLYGYRRKARLGVRYVIKKEKLLIGFREKRSNKLADLTRCETLDPMIGNLFMELQELVQCLAAFKTIPQIEIAVGDKEAALVFRHLEALSIEDENKLLNFAYRYNQNNKNDQKVQNDHNSQRSNSDRQLVIYLQPGNQDTVFPLPRGRKDLLSYALKDYDIEFDFHPLDFIQVNREMNEKMIKWALSLLELKKTDTVLDLFCGIGNFTLPMAKFTESVTGVEGETRAIDRAIHNAAKNDIYNVQFFVDNLQAQTSINSPWAQQKFDKILLDPPRTGAEELLPQISQLGASHILYVSCNPSTLARDLGILVKHGYSLAKAGVMDMFPQTAHVESIALLIKV